MWEVGKNNYPSKQYVEWELQGEWVGFPVVPQSLMSKQPMSPFSPALQRGADNRVIDQRLNVTVYNDFTGGMGARRIEEGGDVTTYSKGTLDTRNRNYLVLPPAASLQKATGVTFTAPVYMAGGVVPANLQQTVIFFGPRQNGAVHLNKTTLTQTALFAGFYVREIVRFRGAMYASLVNTGTGAVKLQKSTDGGVTWADVAASVNKYTGLTVHDNRLFSFDTSTFFLVTSNDGVTFTNASEELWLDTGETLWQLGTWTTPDGREETIYVLTNMHVFVLEEEPGAWHDFYNFQEVIDLDYPRMHFWRRTNFLYVTNYDPNDLEEVIVLVLNGSTSDEVGPQKLQGLPQEVLTGISQLHGNVHNLYAFGIGGVLPDGTISRGQIIAMQELGGWHPIIDGNKIDGGASSLVGGGYYNQEVWGVLANGKIFKASDKDRRVKHPSPIVGQYDLERHSIYSVTDTMGLPNVWKVGAYFVIDAELPDGSHGIPTGSNVCLYYRLDGGAWVGLPCYGSTESDPVGLLLMQSLRATAVTWPVLLTLPDAVSQVGAPFKELQWRLDMQRTSATTSPAIREVSLYYSLWLEQFYSLSFNLDLREETFNKFGGQSFGKYDRDQLLEKLHDIATHRGYLRFRYSSGVPGVPVTQLESTDLLMAARLVTNNAGGVYQISLRDLSHPTLV